MSQLPRGTLGDAIGVLFHTFSCLLANVLVLWLVWVHRERSSYVALIGYFALLCTTSSIVQQIYNYELWNDLMWAQLRYIKSHPGNADVIFNNGNFGFQLVLANIRLFCYIIESTYMLSFAIQITGSVYGFWTLHRRLERQYELFSKILPIFPTALTIGLLQAPAVHRSFLAYMVIANTQSVFCCAASMVLLIVILVKYINTKRQIEGWRAWYRRKWKGFRSSSRNILYPKAQQARSTTFPGNDSFEQISSSVRNESSTSSWDQKIRYSAPAIYDSWLVTRLAILTVMLSGFILASVLTHLPQKADVERDARASEPDLSPGRASSNIVGYMPGVTPSLVLFVVFGTTRTLRQTMYERFVPRGIRLGRQRQRQQQQQQGTRPSTPPLRPGGGEHSYRAIPLQSPPFARQRSGSVPGEGHRSYFAGSTTTKPGLRIDAPHVGSGTYAEKRVGTDIGSDEIGISPILEHEMYHGNWR